MAEMTVRLRSPAPITALKALVAMRSLGKRMSPAHVRVRAPFLKLMKRLTTEQFNEYAADPMGTDEKVRKWCNLSEDQYYTVSVWPNVRAGEVRVNPALHRVVRMNKVSKSNQP